VPSMNEPQTQPARQGSARPMRLFLVEDSPAVRELIVENLSDIANLEVAGFSETESDAFRLLNQQWYDVIILDIELRQGNGISLLRSLAALPERPDSLKIIFSNNVSSAYRRIGAQYGVQYFFDKTTEMPRLHSLLAQATQGVTLD
jgi:DNA-binding NarL/FixJ family response regulator